MIRSSGAAKAVALSAAIAAHGALALALSVPEAAQIEGADGAAEVRLGDAFQDMVAGTLTPERSDTTKPDPTPETVEPEQADRVTPDAPDEAQPNRVTDRMTASLADRVAADRPKEAMAAPLPQAARQVQPEIAAPDMLNGTLASTTAVASERVTAEPAKPVSPPTAASAEKLSSVAPDLRNAALAPTTAQVAERVVPKATTPPADTSPEKLSSVDPDSAAVARSLRPKQRSVEFETAHKPAAQPKPVKRKQQKAPSKQAQGGAPRNARAGASTGKAAATARQSGSGGRTKDAGNAAASNYPGLVMRRLSRSGKPRVNARGTAVVAFSISSGGGVASVSLARSSGSAALDKAAVRLVRGAGPFPKPPQGARRSFSIQIKGR